MKSWKKLLPTLGGITLLIIAVSCIGFVIPGVTTSLALEPRALSGLTGIITMPLVHGSLTHLAVNVPPFIVMSILVMLAGLTQYAFASAFIIVVGGLLLWLMGQPGLHIGASGLIFGYLGYLLARGYYDRRLSSLTIALGVAVVYGSLLWGILPNQPGISWDGHLAGLVAGVIAARVNSGRST